MNIPEGTARSPPGAHWHRGHDPIPDGRIFSKLTTAANEANETAKVPPHLYSPVSPDCESIHLDPAPPVVHDFSDFGTPGRHTGFRVLGGHPLFHRWFAVSAAVGNATEGVNLFVNINPGEFFRGSHAPCCRKPAPMASNILSGHDAGSWPVDPEAQFPIKLYRCSRSVRTVLNSAGFSSINQCPVPSITR